MEETVIVGDNLFLIAILLKITITKIKTNTN